jgi:amino-acid N-acetyltransferase
MQVREATLPDARAIHGLIESYSGTLLPRNLAEVCENIRDFVVVESEGRIVGCGALHLYGPHLAELRSIAVAGSAQGGGAGRLLVEALLREGERHRVSRVCLFTLIPSFFAKLGFVLAAREDLPDKMYRDCLGCPKLERCDEVAMVKGVLPRVASLKPRARRA